MADLFQSKVRQTIATYAMCNAGDRVLVALSGGADSVALLHALLSLREDLKLGEITAAHLHHGLRGEEADRDLAFVQSLCQRWQVPLVYACEDVADFAAAHHLGVEEAGRQVRYAFLQEKANGALIATAHTATDNTETLLMHLTRGCGLQGLTGIAPYRDGVIRPLIDCSREEVEAYCRVHALDFVTDSTNADVRYARNRIRHEVLPALRALNPSLEAATKRLVSLCTQDNAYLNTLAEQAFTSLKTDKYGRYALSDMRAVPPALRGRVWQKMLAETVLSYDDIARLEQALDACGSVCLQGGFAVAVSRRDIQIVLPSVPTEQPQQPLLNEGTYRFAGKSYVYRRISAEEYKKIQNVHKNVLLYAWDCDRISGSLRLTVRQDADCIRLPFRQCSKTLKKLYNEQHIPVSEREAVPVLRDEKGIVLLAGITCDERVKITENTKTVGVFAPVDVMERM